MFRIRRIYDDVLPVNQTAIRHVQDILLLHFPDASEEDKTGLGQKLRDPFKKKFRHVLFVAETSANHVLGFALVMYEPKINIAYLDYMAAAKAMTNRGIGGALYEAVRDEARRMGGRGLFFECLPDDAQACTDPARLRENRARLRFYERYGARPIINTGYEAPIKPGDSDMPCLVYDDLDTDAPLNRQVARDVVRAILERKYRHLCPRDYVEKTVSSFRDDPVQIRPPQYGGTSAPRKSKAPPRDRRVRPIALVVNDRHDIHHVRERGYVEAPARVGRILDSIRTTDLFEPITPETISMKWIKAVHDSEYVEYLRRVCLHLPTKSSVYPYVFPWRNHARPPKELAIRAGYYCIDTFTPLNRNAFLAARRAADCAITAARTLLQGHRLAYALVRPPGHHAERRCFGGFCYFNNTAIAANYLTAHGRVAILDLDYHHGNGQQDIFYARDDVLTVSIHCHPNIAYPYFTGFADERGEGDGKGYNLNLPLPETITVARYQDTLKRALRAVARHRPMFLVVALGLDTAKRDPTGTWGLVAADFLANGQQVAQLAVPTLVVQEGGYRTQTLGLNARSFFEGLYTGVL